MGTKLYVGNLSFNTTETDLQDLFAQAGPVQEVMLMQDKFTGKSRGFAFVTMTNEADAQKAVSEFNGKTIEGRPLTVNEARPREPRPPGGPRGGGGYGGGGGGYGGGGGGGVMAVVAEADVAKAAANDAADKPANHTPAIPIMAGLDSGSWIPLRFADLCSATGAPVFTRHSS